MKMETMALESMFWLEFERNGVLAVIEPKPMAFISLRQRHPWITWTTNPTRTQDNQGTIGCPHLTGEMGAWHEQLRPWHCRRKGTTTFSDKINLRRVKWKVIDIPIKRKIVQNGWVVQSTGPLVVQAGPGPGRGFALWFKPSENGIGAGLRNCTKIWAHHHCDGKNLNVQVLPIAIMMMISTRLARCSHTVAASSNAPSRKWFSSILQFVQPVAGSFETPPSFSEISLSPCYVTPLD